MFIDKAKIFIKAGKGGNGAISFHREKYVAAGGPDGGDGGKGGNVIFKVELGMTTLMDFRYKRKYVAQNGMDGSGKRQKGKKGEDIIIKVPQGTIVRDAESNRLIADLSDPDKEVVLERGGNGGWGNAHFATAIRQTPNFAKNGQTGDEREIVLELKLLADVGLVGFPNVGKSTLLSMTTKADPKIANYHFISWNQCKIHPHDAGGPLAAGKCREVPEGCRNCGVHNQSQKRGNFSGHLPQKTGGGWIFLLSLEH